MAYHDDNNFHNDQLTKFVLGIQWPDKAESLARAKARLALAERIRALNANLPPGNETIPDEVIRLGVAFANRLARPADVRVSPTTVGGAEFATDERSVEIDATGYHYCGPVTGRDAETLFEGEV